MKYVNEYVYESIVWVMRYSMSILMFLFFKILKKLHAENQCSMEAKEPWLLDNRVYVGHFWISNWK